MFFLYFLKDLLKILLACSVPLLLIYPVDLVYRSMDKVDTVSFKRITILCIAYIVVVLGLVFCVDSNLTLRAQQRLSLRGCFISVPARIELKADLRGLSQDKKNKEYALYQGVVSLPLSDCYIDIINDIHYAKKRKGMDKSTIQNIIRKHLSWENLLVPVFPILPFFQINTNEEIINMFVHEVNSL